MNCKDGVSLRELLETEAFRGYKILAGSNGLDRKVRGVNQIDAPDFQFWVQPDQLLVTTGFLLQGNDKALQELLSIAAARHLSGICIKADRFMKVYPSFMLEAANRDEIPIIELPLSCRFADLTEAIYLAILQQQREHQLHLLQINNMLLKLLVEGGNMDSIANALSALLGNSILIVDNINKRHALCLTPAGTSQLEHLPLQSQQSSCQSDLILEYYKEDCSLQPLVSNGVNYGCLYVWTSDRELTATDSETINELLLVITLAIIRESTARKAENEPLTDFTYHLFNDKILDERYEEQRAAALGFHMDAPHAVVLIRISSNYDTATKAVSVERMNRNAIINEIDLLLNARGYTSHIAKEGNSYLFIMDPGVSSMQRIAEKNLKNDLVDLLATVSSHHPQLSITINCGTMRRGIKGMIRSYHEANIVSRARDALGRSDVLAFTDIDIFRFIFSEKPQTEINNFVAETFGDLLAYGSADENTLLSTLEMYFNCQCNLGRMAKQMFIHYNTGTYRLKRIEELTGLSLSNRNDRFRLEMALRMYKFAMSSGMDKE